MTILLATILTEVEQFDSELDKFSRCAIPDHSSGVMHAIIHACTSFHQLFSDVSRPAHVVQVVTVTLDKEDVGKPVWWTSALRGHPEIDLHTIPGYDPVPDDIFDF